MTRFLACCALILAVAAPPRSARADGPGAEDSRGAARAFDERVAPVLARHCLECHGATLRKGGLSLATEDAFRKGGRSGPAVDPGEPESSLLWEHVASGTMPKGRPGLSGDEKASSGSGSPTGPGGALRRSIPSPSPRTAAPATTGGRSSRSDLSLLPR